MRRYDGKVLVPGLCLAWPPWPWEEQLLAQVPKVGQPPERLQRGVDAGRADHPKQAVAGVFVEGRFFLRVEALGVVGRAGERRVDPRFDRGEAVGGQCAAQVHRAVLVERAGRRRPVARRQRGERDARGRLSAVARRLQAHDALPCPPCRSSDVHAPAPRAIQPVAGVSMDGQALTVRGVHVNTSSSRFPKTWAMRKR